MKKKLSILMGTVAMGALCLFASGCLTTKTTTITPGGTNSQGQVFGPVTNTVTTVNQANLQLECAALKLVGTPAVTYVLANDKSGEVRPIVMNIQMALNGTLNGLNGDTNIVGTINNLISKNAMVQAQFTPLVQAADALRAQLLAKYGSVVSVQISLSILQADLDIVTAALAAVPAPAAK